MSGFGARLQQLRRQNKLTQEDLADQIGVAQSTISSWEKGEKLHNFTVPHMFRLARALRVDPRQLFPAEKSGPTIWLGDYVPPAIGVEVRKDLGRRPARPRSDGDAEGAKDGKSGQFKRVRKRTDEDED